jgi:hypothetical protein
MPTPHAVLPPQTSRPNPARADQGTPVVVSRGEVLTTPQLAYRSAVAARNELRYQISELNSRRYPIADRLRQHNATGADLAGLEKRITIIDDQIAVVEKQLAAADGEVAKAAAVPGSVEPSSSNPFDRISNRDREFVLTAMFILVVLFPISLALARRLWRRGTAAVANIPRDLSERFSRLEQSMESVAIEVERIGEGQRFMTNVLVDSVSERALGPGTMEALAVKQRELAEPLRRE